jgi:hypothetical protein
MPRQGLNDQTPNEFPDVKLHHLLIGSAAMLEAPAVVAGLDDIAMVGDAVEQGRVIALSLQQNAQ